MAARKIPRSVLVLIHTPGLEILLLERVAPTGFWQSVTGSQEPGESLLDTATREVAEETGLQADPGQMVDWRLANRFALPAAALPRYPEGVRHNVEWVFSYPVAEAFAPRLAPREHVAAQWLPWPAAWERASSWTNRDAIRLVAASNPGRA